MQKEANLGYVTAVVKFNASATDANIGPNMKYEVWYNQTIVEESTEKLEWIISNRQLE